MADRPTVPPSSTAAESRVPTRARRSMATGEWRTIVPESRQSPDRRESGFPRPGRHGRHSDRPGVAEHPVSPGPAPAGGYTGAGFTTNPDAPLLDLIFPNREQAGGGFDQSFIGQTTNLAGRGRAATPRPKPNRLRDRAAGLLRRRAKVTRVATPGGVRRRRVLLGLGTGVVVAGGAGTGIAMLTGTMGSSEPEAGAGNPLAGTADGLGAAGLADSPSAAAKIAAGSTPTFATPLSRDPELHLLRRATLGLTPIDVVAMRQMGIDAWLERQLTPNEIADPVQDQIATIFPTVNMSTAQIRTAVKDGDYQAMFELAHATLARQIWSNRQLFEVMVDFWANHLNIVNPMDGGWDTRSPYDREVIRTHAFGRYSDMLSASARHPAMMRYLNNNESDRRSVNENYGRELLELHSVGLDAKYTEKDVRQSAYIMSGRTIDDQGRFTYKSNRHYIGKVTVMSFTDANSKAANGLALGDKYVAFLAMHPATAHRIAFKLARRFVCDDPPTTLVDRLAQSYLDNGSAIIPVLRTLFSSVEFWMSTGLKTRRPLENVVATARILGVKLGKQPDQGLEGLYNMTNELGHAPLRWSPPDGYADYAEAWGSAHATLGTWNSHRALVRGYHEGLTYPSAETLVGGKPATVGAYLDALAERLLFQPLQAKHKTALLTFLAYKDNTKVKTPSLGGKIQSLVPLLLDSVYHTLR